MLKTAKKITALVVFFLTLLFIVFIVNQTSQIFGLLTEINPLLGRTVLFVMLLVYAAVIILPLVAILRRPKAMFPPKDGAAEELSLYIVRLSKRLSKNPHLSGYKIKAEEIDTVKEALKKLDQLAEEKIKVSATNVFVMTAISQYGALDALIVTLAQLRMIWQITLLYNQRPSLRELGYLYGNVFATAFLAAKIENLDLLEDQLEPVIASIMGSSLSSLTPAINTAANVITNAVIQGSANAYLTLRVGVITRQYCSSLVSQERSSLRRIAAVEAASLLAKVLGESTYNISRAVLRATAKAGTRPIRYGHKVVTKTTRKTWDRGKLTLKKAEEMAKSFGDALKDGGDKLTGYLKQKRPDPKLDDE